MQKTQIRRPIFTTWSSNGLVTVVTDPTNWNTITTRLLYAHVKLELITDRNDHRWQNVVSILSTDDPDLLHQLEADELVLGSIKGTILKKITKAQQILSL